MTNRVLELFPTTVSWVAAVAVRRAWLLGVALLAATPGWADLPSPYLAVLQPIGGTPGTEVELTIAGNELDDVETLRFSRPGFQVQRIEANKFKVTIDAQVPRGTYDVVAVGRFGASNPRLFQVLPGFASVLEVEPNQPAAVAQPIELNSVVSGTCDGNSQDLYRFAGVQGQRIIAEVFAARLDSEMDATLTLKLASGRTLATNGDYIGRDPLVDVALPETGPYELEVRDLTYRGGFPYRLLVTNGPHIETVFPRAVQAGQTARLQLLGRNLGTNARPSEWRLGAFALDELPVDWTGSGPLHSNREYQFVEHPTQYSVLPTAATCSVVGEEFSWQGLPAGPVLVCDEPVTIERESNNSREIAQPITLPAVIAGRFDLPRDRDWFEFTAEETGPLHVEVFCERIAGRADPVVACYDKDGNRFAEHDDFGHRRAAFDGHLRDPVGTFNVTAGQQVRVLVQDRYQRGGARYQYVVRLRKPQPDFFAASIHRTPQRPTGLNLWAGSSDWVDVIVHHWEGFRGPITITAEGLPPGVHCRSETMLEENLLPVMFWADESAAAWTGPIQLWAEARDGDRVLRHRVRPHTRTRDNENSSRAMQELVLAVREPGPYALALTPERIEIPQGGKADVQLTLTRRWPGFQGAVNYQAQSWPGSFQMANGTIAEGQSTATVSISVQGNQRPGEQSLLILGQAQVPFNKDKAANDKAPVLVPVVSQPLLVVVTPAK